MQAIEFFDYKSNLVGLNTQKTTYKNAIGNNSMILVLQNHCFINYIGNYTEYLRPFIKIRL